MPKASTTRFVAEMCRASFYQFFLQAWELVSAERLVVNWHLQFLCDELQALSERVFRGLPREHDWACNCPPGMTKSKIVSVLWQPWAWTRMPSCRFITGSYSERLSLDLARQSRDVVTSEWYNRLFPEIELRDDQNTKGFFMNTRQGWRFSTGVGGTATGLHAHIIAIDDPIDPQGAMSDLVLDEANSWMNETLPDRTVDKQLTPTALIQQRLHQNDPTGNRLERGRVRHVCLPCDDSWDVKPPELRARYEASGGLLDPVRLPRGVLDEAETRGEAYYSGQYGQNPVPRGGAMFKVDRVKYRRASEIPKHWKRGPVRYWDKASTAATVSRRTSSRAAFTAGVLGGLDADDEVWILDVERDQWDSGTREKNITRVARRDGRRTRVGVEQEPAGSGKESAEATVKRLTLAGFHAYADRATGDKALRADPLSVYVNLGKVNVVVGPWNRAFVEEMRFFPRSRYKDQIDAASGMFAGLTRRRLKIGALRPRSA